MEKKPIYTPTLTARTTWRQLVTYLNAAGYYAQRTARRGVPGRERGFSVHELDDGSIALAYGSTSGEVATEEREAMLANYAAVFTKLQLAFDVAADVIVVHGWAAEHDVRLTR